MLSIGNLGGNLRELVGTTMTTGFNFALLEFDDRGLVDISAYLGPDFEKKLDRASLPAIIGTGEQRLQLRKPRAIASPP